MVPAVLVIISGYLIGAIPTGVAIARKLAKVDIRQYGSGSTGATNALRTAGKKVGAMVFLADMAKGAAAVFLAGLLMGDRTFALGHTLFHAREVQVGAAVAAILGHNWSVFLKFHGGKGVSTFYGALLALAPIVAVITGIGTLIIIALSRYVSLGSILGAIGTVAVLLLMVSLGRQPEDYLFFALPAMALILFQHRENIYRLFTGTERKLGEAARRLN